MLLLLILYTKQTITHAHTNTRAPCNRSHIKSIMSILAHTRTLMDWSRVVWVWICCVYKKQKKKNKIKSSRFIWMASIQRCFSLFGSVATDERVQVVIRHFICVNSLFKTKRIVCSCVLCCLLIKTFSHPKYQKKRREIRKQIHLIELSNLRCIIAEYWSEFWITVFFLSSSSDFQLCGTTRRVCVERYAARLK